MLVCSGCTEEQLVSMVNRNSSAEIEYHPPSSKNPQSKKVQVVSTSKCKLTSDSKVAVDGQQQPESKGRRPVWNSNVRHRAAPVSQSNRDPTYERRQARRLERQRHLLAQAAANERLIPQRRFVGRDHHQQNHPETIEQRVEHNNHRRRPSPESSSGRGESQPCHIQPSSLSSFTKLTVTVLSAVIVVQLEVSLVVQCFTRAT